MKPFLTIAFVLLCGICYGFKDTLYIQDFETSPKTPTWTFSGSPVYNSGNSASGAAPANSPIGIGGSRAWETTTNSSGSVLEFSNITVPSGYDSIAIEFSLAAMNLGGSSGGPDNLDWVLVEISTDGGSTYYNRLRVRGAVANNSYWPYSASGVAEAYYTPQSEVTFAPANSGLQTTEGYSKVIVKFPGSLSQVRARITARSSSSSDTWLIDNVMVTGESSCTGNPGSSRSISICQGKSFFVGGKQQTTAGTYYDTVKTKLGCDSVITTFLVVNPTYSTSQSATICQGDSILLGKKYRTTAGTYYDTLASSKFCDSIVATTLTVNPTYSTPQTITICQGDSIMAAGGYQTGAGMYYDTLQTTGGCDSIIVTTLVVNPVYNVAQTVTICKGDSVLAGGGYQKVPGMYYDSLQTTNGCDSVIVTTVIVNPVYTLISNITICQGDSVWAGGNYQQLPGIFYDSLKTVTGCDSIIFTNLMVNPSYFITTSVSICAYDSVLINGTYVKTAGSYVDSFTTVQGCDSLVGITLSINAVDIAVAQTLGGTLLQAAAAGAQYQWLDCNNNFAPLPNQTGQTFTATTNGSYAVEITQNSCVDTSACYTVVGIGMGDIGFIGGLKVYPNPATRHATINLGNTYAQATVKVFTVTGRMVIEQNTGNTQYIELDTENMAPGIYLLDIQADGKQAVAKLVIE